MTDKSVIARRLRGLPPIRRARLWRLYAEERGAERRRFLDLWMDGGRAIIGAKGTGIGTAAKAAIDMGLLRPMPSAWERRLAGQLRITYPEYAAARFFRTDERALAAAGAGGAFDPARREAAGAADPSAAAAAGRVLVLRPFAEGLAGPGAGDFPVAMPLLPCPSALSPSVLLFREAKDAARIAGDVLPPVLLSSAHRALCELARMRPWYAEELWRKADKRLGRFFERRGPYLYLRDPGALPAAVDGRAAPGARSIVDYDAFFDAALEAGVLLSPDPELPSIVPGDFDDGELKALSEALAGCGRP